MSLLLITVFGLLSASRSSPPAHLLEEHPMREILRNLGPGPQGPCARALMDWTSWQLALVPDELAPLREGLLASMIHRCEATPQAHFVVMRFQASHYLKRHAHIEELRRVLADLKQWKIGENVVLFERLHRLGMCLPTICVSGDDALTGSSLLMQLLVQWSTFTFMMHIPLSLLPRLDIHDLTVRGCCNPGSNETFRHIFGNDGSYITTEFQRSKVDALADQLRMLSFPKCGSTWLGIMLTKAATMSSIVGSASQLQQDLSSVIPATHGDHVHGHPLKLTGSQLETTFEEFISQGRDPFEDWKDEQWKGTGGRRKTLLLMRDPLDVLVSLYYERTRRTWGFWRLPNETSLDQFARDLEQSGSLGTYISFLNKWVLEAKQLPHWVLIVHYETLLHCPVHVLSRILNSFLGLNVSCAALRFAVRTSDIASMRAAARRSSSHSLAPGSHVDVNSYKFRRGKAHVAHHDLSRESYARARNALSALDSDVRQSFVESSHICYELGNERHFAHTWEARTEDVACDG